jgi:MFS family permease
MNQSGSRLAKSAQPLDRAAYLALAASAGLSSIQFWMTVPLAALALAGRGSPPWQIGRVGAVPWLTLVALIPLVPKLAARFRALRVFRIGCWLGLAGAVTFAAGDAVWLWILGYGLCGAGIALRWIVSDALIAVLSPPGIRGARVGLFEAWIGATMALGPLILALAGIHGSLPFTIGVVLATIALPPALLVRIPAAETAPGRGEGSLRTLAEAVRRTPTALIAATACGVIEGASTKLLPVQAYGLGMTEAVAAASVAVFGAGNILTQYPTGRLADRLPVRRLLPFAFVIIALAALMLPSAVNHPAVWFALLATIGGLSGSLYTLSVFQAGRATSPLAAMAVVAGISLTYTLGSTLGAPLAGAAISANLRWGLPLLLSGTAVVGLTLAWLVGRPCPACKSRRYRAATETGSQHTPAAGAGRESGDAGR